MLNTSGNYTLILLNGKRMSSNGAMWRGNDFDWSAIPLNSIERVEVIQANVISMVQMRWAVLLTLLPKSRRWTITRFYFWSI